MSKKLIIVCGLPYSGKSTLAEIIAKNLKTTLLSVDPIESAIIQSGTKRNLETGLAAYYIVKNLADEQLKQNNGVIIDAVSGTPKIKAMWRKLATAHNVKPVIIECYCSDSKIHDERRIRRNRVLLGIPELSSASFKIYKDEYTTWHEPHLKLDSVVNVSTNLKNALEYINLHA